MQVSRAVIGLSLLICLLALVATSIGLFREEGGSPFVFTTVRGTSVLLYGAGLYRYETLFIGAGLRGQDLVMLMLGVPLLLVSVWLYRQGSVRGGLLLAGTLASFLYVYLTMAVNAAYNELFLLYVALFSSSLFAVGLILYAFDCTVFATSFTVGMPRRTPAIFMFISGGATLVLWLSPIIESMVTGTVPGVLGNYTTLVTFALDLAIITPATFLCGRLLLQGKPVGYLMAFPLFGIIILLLPVIIASTISQISAGVSFTPAEIIGPISGFAILGVVAVRIVWSILRHIGKPSSDTVGQFGRSGPAQLHL